MNRFSEIVPLALTPLTPIHIGCGEDFKPTNYVIDGGILYHFEPSSLPLDEADRRLLIQSANQPGIDAILAVQRFFHGKRSDCQRISRFGIPVAAGIADWYEGRIGRVVQQEGGGRRVSNELGIERTAHHPYTGIPYLPGSSLKGSARTAWVNALDCEPVGPRNRTRPPQEKANELERTILGGSFSSDPFRGRICRCGGRRSQEPGCLRGRSPQASATRQAREGSRRSARAITGGQFRAAQGEIRLKSRPACSDPKDTPRAEKCIGDFAELARAFNRFYRSRLEADLEVLAVLGEARWAGAFKSLIDALAPALDDGRAMLLRVGRHSGAESVTIERHRWIRIIGKRGAEPHWDRDATTIWLAADYEDSRADLRPFGWLLLERADDLLVSDDLRRWCEQEINTPTKRSVAREVPPIVPARSGARSSAPAGHTSASRAQAAHTSPLFRRGDRVRNAEGEIGIVSSDVKIDETTMTIEIDGDLETVRVAEWKTA